MLDLGRYELAAVDAYNAEPNYYDPPFEQRPLSVDSTGIDSLVRSTSSEPPPSMKAPVADYIRSSTYHDMDLPRKLAGDTHISMLSRELRQTIANELSVEKPNRADWRLFAERVGISMPTIEGWYADQMSNPAEAVLSVWGRSQGATVKILHRHLLSPQLRYLVAARLLADAYDV